MINYINMLLIQADKFSDYIPILSSITNLVDIFQKCLIIPLLKEETIKGNHYFTHLQDKSLKVCIASLIPVFGNVASKIIKDDLKMGNELTNICKDKSYIQFASSSLKDDEKVIGFSMGLNSAEQSIRLSRYADAKALEQSENQSTFRYENLQYASERVTLLILRKHPELLKYARIDLQTNSSFLLRILSKVRLEWSSDQRRYLRVAEYQNPDILKFVKEELKHNLDFMLSAVLENESSISYVPQEMMENQDFILDLLALGIFPKADNNDKAGRFSDVQMTAFDKAFFARASDKETQLIDRFHELKQFSEIREFLSKFLPYRSAGYLYRRKVEAKNRMNFHLLERLYYTKKEHKSSMQRVEEMEEIKEWAITELKKSRANAFMLMILPQSIREDKVFMLEAIKENPIAIAYASASLKADKDFMRQAQDKNKDVLMYRNTFQTVASQISPFLKI